MVGSKINERHMIASPFCLSFYFTDRILQHDNLGLATDKIKRYPYI